MTGHIQDNRGDITQTLWVSVELCMRRKMPSAWKSFAMKVKQNQLDLES